LELDAVVRAFHKRSYPLNIVTDSAYVAGIVELAEAAYLKAVRNAKLYMLLQTLTVTLNKRCETYFVMYARSHTLLPGPIMEGNRKADLLTMPIQIVPDSSSQAHISHAFYHQNAQMSWKQFSLSIHQAQDIVAVCSDSQRPCLFSTTTGVNP
ncbi:POK10 protein, partial [Hemiprocne comata]|nr:POK10 protein [Hemiprocne comata]